MSGHQARPNNSHQDDYPEIDGTLTYFVQSGKRDNQSVQVNLTETGEISLTPPPGTHEVTLTEREFTLIAQLRESITTTHLDRGAGGGRLKLTIPVDLVPPAADPHSGYDAKAKAAYARRPWFIRLDRYGDPDRFDRDALPAPRPAFLKGLVLSATEAAQFVELLTGLQMEPDELLDRASDLAKERRKKGR
jgi:hypothetical protein